jgi:L-rhamnose mutarotase
LLFFRELGVKPVRRFAQVTRLTPEHEAKYVRYHADVWPGVLKTIAECEIANYSIFLSNGFLFSYFEYHGNDYEADMRKMASSSEMQRWWTIMNPTLASLDPTRPEELWLQMQEVFHFEGSPAQALVEAAAKVNG